MPKISNILPKTEGKAGEGRRTLTVKVQQRPERDFVLKSRETKNKLYGPQFEDKKHIGANKPWNQSRPLANKGKRGNYKKGV